MTKQRFLSIAIALASLVPSILAAEEAAPAPVEPPPEPTPQTEPTESTTPVDAQATPQKPTRTAQASVGVGGGVVFWPPLGDDVVGELVPAVALQTRTAFVVGGLVGFEWTNDIVFHDFATMKAGYEWFFKKPETEDEKDLQFLKIFGAWPVLALIPFAGANYTSGLGLVMYTAPSAPSFYVDLGLNASLFFRFSDRDFIADIGAGAYGGVGFDFSRNFGIGVRAMWGSPFIHQLIRKSSGGITTVIGTLNVGF